MWTLKFTESTIFPCLLGLKRNFESFKFKISISQVLFNSCFYSKSYILYVTTRQHHFFAQPLPYLLSSGTEEFWLLSVSVLIVMGLKDLEKGDRDNLLTFTSSTLSSVQISFWITSVSAKVWFFITLLLQPPSDCLIWT